MATVNDLLHPLTPAAKARLASIQAEAKVRHEKARKAAAKRGRVDFPLLPYECSWAYEMEFQRSRMRELN